MYKYEMMKQVLKVLLNYIAAALLGEEISESVSEMKLSQSDNSFLLKLPVSTEGS